MFYSPPVLIFTILLLSNCCFGLRLHGTRSSRSPLINWYCLEANIDFEQVPSRPSNHPFDQTPFLTDNNNVEVFESGAILLYLADKYGKNDTPEDRAKYTKWVVWSNSELDNICFGGMKGINMRLDQPNKAIEKLESMLENDNYLVDNTFSVADVAVASYLNYVPLFYRDINLSKRPNMCKYMQRNAERQSFADAFGEDHQSLILSKTNEWLSTPAQSGNTNMKKQWGLF